MRVCSVSGCNELHVSRGLCNAHYHQFKRAGTLDLDSKVIDKKLVGQRFGLLLVIDAEWDAKRHRIAWICLCNCGSRYSVNRSHSLRSGHTRSCGCLTKAPIHPNGKTHGKSRTREYRSWISAKQRCENPKCNNYPEYGGRGIAMCEEWRNSFESFFAYMGKRPNGMTLERKDSNKNYEPGNCVWATPVQQTRNRRSTVKVRWNGRDIPLAEVANELRISYSAAQRQVKQGILVRVN